MELVLSFFLCLKEEEFVKEFGKDLVEVKFLNFRKVVSKSMGDMRIGVIVSEVLLSPNVLERSPAWQVSSLEKKILIFLSHFPSRN